MNTHAVIKLLCKIWQSIFHPLQLHSLSQWRIVLIFHHLKVLKKHMQVYSKHTNSIQLMKTQNLWSIATAFCTTLKDAEKCICKKKKSKNPPIKGFACFKSLTYFIINDLNWTKIFQNSLSLRIIHGNQYSAVEFP